MKDIVKYDNYFNSINFNGLKSNELNVIMALCAKMKEKGTECVKFTYSELKEAMFVKHITDEELKTIIKSASNKLRDVNGEIILPDGREVDFNLFPTRINDPNERTFTIRVNNDVSFILNDLTKNFTLFELSEFVSLNSKYSKHLYRLLKRFRTTGKLVIDDIEDFKMKLGSPKSYKTKDFKKFVLDVAMNELKEKEYFKNLKVKPKTAKKRGSPVIAYTFTFEAEQIKKNPITDYTIEQHRKKGAEQEERNYIKQEPVEPKEHSEISFNNVPVATPKTNNRFCQFPQREYSKEHYAELERRLIRRN